MTTEEFTCHGDVQRVLPQRMSDDVITVFAEREDTAVTVGYDSQVQIGGLAFLFTVFGEIGDGWYGVA